MEKAIQLENRESKLMSRKEDRNRLKYNKKLNIEENELQMKCKIEKMRHRVT